LFSVENGGFENWEVPPGLDSTLMEPVDWSSLKTTDNSNLNGAAPVVWGKSTIAHSGNYSVYLKNVSIFGIVANGTLTNGRVHSDMNPEKGYVFTDTSDGRWNSRIDSRPDSVVGWYRFHPVDNDRGIVEVDLHTGYYQKPGTPEDSTRLVGKAIFKTPTETVDEWTRFAVPFEYFDDRIPEFYLFVLSSGDGYDARAGSEIWFDDIAFVYNNLPAEKPDLREETLNVYVSFGTINIRLSAENSGGYRVVVTDILGRRVYQNRLTVAEELTVNPGRSGIYIVRVVGNNEVYTRKVLIK